MLTLLAPSTGPRTLQEGRVEAVRLAWLLVGPADAIGAYVSTCLRVRIGPRELCPHLAVVHDDPPVDGCIEGAPDLVVLLAGAGGRAGDPAGDLARWLTAGTAAVWCVGPDGVTEHTGRGSRARHGDQPLEVPGLPGVTLTAAQLLGPRFAGTALSPRADMRHRTDAAATV